MKLKGKLAKKIPKAQKGKMQKTLKRMSKTREDDSAMIREKAEQKLAWLLNEKAKGEQAIGKLRNQLTQINGAIIVLKEMLNPKQEEK